jgi:hypothetical protein
MGKNGNHMEKETEFFGAYLLWKQAVRLLTNLI